MVAILYRSYALNPNTNIVVINVVIVLDFVFNNFSRSVGRSKIILQLIYVFVIFRTGNERTTSSMENKSYHLSIQIRDWQISYVFNR